MIRKNCDCYHTEKRRDYIYHPITKEPIGYDIKVGVCWGTKEREECSCGGDKTQCDFYPEVRKKEVQEEDSLIVTYDYCSPDVPTLCIAKVDEDEVEILNIVQGDEAFEVYHYLTGDAELKHSKDIPKKPIGDLNSVPHYRCPSCNGGVVMYCDDNKYPYCQWCGQKLDWK